MSNIEQILRQRIAILTAEIQVLVSVEEAENAELIALISEIEDLNGQLEFVISTQSQFSDQIDKDENYVYDDEDDEEDEEFLEPPVLRRQVAIWC